MRTIARLASRDVSESSGVTASRRNPGVYWTHNDSGDGPYIYAFDRDGRDRGRWTVRGARAADWEDIASGPGPKRGRPYLYIGDIGDNSRRRKSITVYRVEEPAVGACGRNCTTAAATAIRLRYPGGPRDAEALLVHPVTGDIYVVTKAGRNARETRVYRARAGEGLRTPAVMTHVATLDVPDALFGLFSMGITGGEISPDGRRVALCDYFRAYEAELPAGAAFETIWKRPFTAIPLGVTNQVEGICYRADGKVLIATSEGHPCPVIEISRP